MLNTVLPALAASALLAAFSLWIYLRRELPVRGRVGLALVRAAVFTLLILLLADPVLPVPGRAPTGHDWVLIDASASMFAGEGGSDVDRAGGTPWALARQRAAVAAAGGARLLLLGETPEPVDDTLAFDDVEVGGHGSVLVPALRHAAEAGARSITVLTDRRVDDAVAVAAELERTGLPLEIDDLGGPVRDAGIALLDAPGTGRAGAPVEVSVEVFATEAAAGAPANLVLERDGEVVAEWELDLPGPGATVRRTVEGELPDSAGIVRWRARVHLADDVFTRDDARLAVTEVDPASGIVALVALAPDWEPRFLLPVLAEVTGLPTRGWLRVGEDRYLPMEGGAAVEGPELRDIVADARVVVVQGRTAAGPPWVEEVAADARRVLTLAADPAGAAAAGVSASPVRGGEWYVTAPPPPSPLAAALGRIEPAQLPPLTRTLPTGDQPGIRTALAAQGPGGATEAVLVLLESDERREAVALASGFWRWAFRPEGPRETYRRVWSAVVGWLLALEEGRTLAGIAPESRVVSAVRPVTWRAPGAAGRAVEIVLARGDSVHRTDTLTVDGAGVARQPPPAEGAYTWHARVLASGAAPDSAPPGAVPPMSDTASEATADTPPQDRVWRGTLDVDSWTDDMRPPRAALARQDGAAPRAARAESGIPLRTSPWPYLLLLVLLSAEWFGRRRSGLR